MANERFDVQFTRETKKDLVRLRLWTEDAIRAVLKLAVDPHFGHARTGNLTGLCTA